MVGSTYTPKEKKQYKFKVMKTVLKVFKDGQFLQYCKVSEVHLFIAALEVGKTIGFKKVRLTNDDYKTFLS